jgi:hypothetical protein
VQGELQMAQQVVTLELRFRWWARLSLWCLVRMAAVLIKMHINPEACIEKIVNILVYRGAVCEVGD